MIKFYIIYSIDIPFWDSEYCYYTIKELFDLLNEKEIELPFEFDGFEEDADEYNEDELFEMYYSEYRENMVELLEEYDREINCNNLIKNNLPYYILNNSEQFKCTESDNFNTEYQYAELTTCHRKYNAFLNEKEFLEFVKEFEYNSTINTMGSLTEYGHLPAFCIEIGGDNIESLYISLIFDEILENDEMERIEENIKQAIENGNINEQMFK